MGGGDGAGDTEKGEFGLGEVEEGADVAFALGGGHGGGIELRVGFGESARVGCVLGVVLGVRFCLATEVEGDVFGEELVAEIN